MCIKNLIATHTVDVEKFRTILHSDLNNFYASVEVRDDPRLKGKPVIVVGNKDDRHGIVLAKSKEAKIMGVRTGDTYWEAKRKCGGIIEIEANFDKYLAASKKVRAIYERYTDRVEAFGIDECWLDVSDSLQLFGDGVKIAERIREEVKKEQGLTVSIGVSFNKIFAKLGSDMKKPDAVTVITPENYKSVVWPLPVKELLYVGKATEAKLKKYGINTIGDLATRDRDFLVGKLGKWGEYLHIFADGTDNTPVVRRGEEENIKSIGNSMTNYRDLKSEDDVETLIVLLADSVAARVRESGLGRATTVYLSVRDSALLSYAKQGKLVFPSRSAGDIARKAVQLFREIYPWNNPVRGVGVAVSGFIFGAEQENMFGEKSERAEFAIDKIRQKYGNAVVCRATVLKDLRLKRLDVKGEHVIHPENFFGK